MIKQLRFLLILMIFIILFSMISCRKAEEVVAEVNGIKISKSDFDYRKAVLEFQRNQEISNGDVLRILVVNKLLAKEAEIRGAAISDKDFDEFLSKIDFNRELSTEKMTFIKNLGYDSYKDFFMHPANLTFMRNESNMWRLRDLIYDSIEKEHMEKLYASKPIDEISQEDLDRTIEKINKDFNDELDNLAKDIHDSINIMIYPEIRSPEFYLHEIYFRIPN